MKKNQFLVANLLAAIFVCNFLLGQTSAARIVVASLVAGVVTATWIVSTTRVVLRRDVRVSSRNTLRHVLVPASVTVLTVIGITLLITFAMRVLVDTEIGVPNCAGAALAGTIAGALAGAIATWPRGEAVATLRGGSLARGLDAKAGAVGAALALAFALGPSGEYKVPFEGVVIGIFTGLVTAAASSRLVRSFGGSIAGALKEAVSTASASTLSFLFGAYLN